MKVDNEIQKKLNDLLDQYTQEVLNSKMEESTKKTYLLHANHFVRWCKGDFIPGGTLEK
ncbi:hypothetical protein ACE3MS_15410 [Paenibacillus dendritiformis]|uniref:hypothetical protein n=1 Tax=Paenibacillus dendritiformis TaxID=130049 RepID=UPI00030A8458|nr:hypothetical protein [Paenibacillus dendritiformis]